MRRSRYYFYEFATSTFGNGMKQKSEVMFYYTLITMPQNFYVLHIIPILLQQWFHVPSILLTTELLVHWNCLHLDANVIFLFFYGLRATFVHSILSLSYTHSKKSGGLRSGLRGLGAHSKLLLRLMTLVLKLHFSQFKARFEAWGRHHLAADIIKLFDFVKIDDATQL